MKVIVKKPFYDLREKVNRKAGEIFEVTEARFNQIAKKGAYIEVVEEEKAVKA